MARLVAFNGWPGDEHNGDVHQGCSQHDSILGIEHHEAAGTLVRDKTTKQLP